MYQGKHIRTPEPKKRRRLRWRKEFLTLCSVIVLLIGVVGGTIAYLVTNTDPVENTFTPAKSDINIPEDFNGEVKKDVKVTNDSEYPVYARATYVAYWVSDAEETKGQILPEVPELTTENINASDWEKIGDYWYCKKILAAGETSPVFITEMTAAKKDGCHLVVDVIAETVQAEPEQAVKDVWGVEPSSFIGQ